MIVNKTHRNQTYLHTSGAHYRARILSTIAFVGAGLSALYATLLLVLYEHSLGFVTDIFFAASYLATFYFIRHEKFSISAYWIVFWAGIQVSAGSALLVGANTGFQLYFLTLPVLIYFLLWHEPIWKKSLVTTYGVLLFAIGHTVHIPDYQANIDQQLANVIFISNALIVFFITFMAVKYFADEIEKAYSRQKELVLLDQLTNLPNNRFIEQHAHQVLALCDRYGHPFSLLNIEIVNNNDHSERQISKIAAFLSDNCREADILARTGENRFTFLLPETPRHNSESLIDRLIISGNETEANTDRNSPPESTIKIRYAQAYCDSHSMRPLKELLLEAEPSNEGFLNL